MPTVQESATSVTSNTVKNVQVLTPPLVSNAKQDIAKPPPIHARESAEEPIV